MKTIRMNRQIFRDAISDAVYKLNPRIQVRNPVMFIVCVGAAMTTILLLRDIGRQNLAEIFFTLQISLWLWFTVLFANFAEAIAEGRGKAQCGEESPLAPGFYHIRSQREGMRNPPQRHAANHGARLAQRFGCLPVCGIGGQLLFDLVAFGG